MGSLIEEPGRREAAARAEAGRLRSRVEELARAEEQVTRLVIAREEVMRVLAGPAGAELPGGPVKEPGPVWPIGAVAVRPWREGAEALVLPQSCQDLLEAAAGAGRPKLKRLTGRGWLAEEPGGLFTLPDHAGKSTKSGR